jgi:hypothetical protein
MPKPKKEVPAVDLAAFRKAVAKAETRLKEAKAELARAEKAAKGGT